MLAVLGMRLRAAARGSRRDVALCCARRRRQLAWYNGEHLHSSLRFVTPDERHRSRDGALLAACHAIYQRARRRTPLRRAGKTSNWTPFGPVTLNHTRTRPKQP